MFAVALIGGLLGTPMMPPPELNPPIILVHTKRRSDIPRGGTRRDENYQGKILKTKLPPMDDFRGA